MERSPAVAGMFYPAEPEALDRQVRACLDAGGATPALARAVVVPHAGYIYSGLTAGRTYAETVVPRRVLLLGPNHTGLGRPAALWCRGAWRTPLGRVPVDEETAAKVLDQVTAIQSDAEAHLREHALEVQLPFLQARCPAVRIVPVCLSDLGADALIEIGVGLAAVVAACPGDTLVVISSDMTHYQSRETARRQDRLAIERMECLDADGLYRTVKEHRISMCGFAPAVTGLALARQVGARAARLVDYTCSGDVTGDDADVVAYAGLAVT